MRDTDTEATFYTVLICLVICFILVCLCQCGTSSSFENEMRRYKYIKVDGVTYKTEDVETVGAEYEYHANDIIILYLKDGTKVSLVKGDCTITDKEPQL